MGHGEAALLEKREKGVEGGLWRHGEHVEEVLPERMTVEILGVHVQA